MIVAERDRGREHFSSDEGALSPIRAAPERIEQAD